MSLATTAQVEAILQVDIIPDDHPKVVELLAMADDEIALALGRSPLGGDETTFTATATAAARAARLFLPLWPITAVASVTVDGSALTVDTDYAAELATGIIRRVGRVWETGVEIVVTYTPADVPGLYTIAAAMVARAIRAGSAYATAAAGGMTGLKQKTVGRWSVTADTGTGALTAGEALHLTPAELATVEGWRDRRSST